MNSTSNPVVAAIADASGEMLAFEPRTTPPTSLATSSDASIREVLEQCLRWHNGDKFRDDADEANREAWEAHKHLLENTLAARPSPANTGEGESAPLVNDSFAADWLTGNAELHPSTINLVVRFARALAEKLAAAEKKYGYSNGWLQADWMDECRAKLLEHVAKSDPRDVAAYCAFLWHHGESTALPTPAPTMVDERGEAKAFDCGEAGCAEGCCGTAECLPSARKARGDFDVAQPSIHAEAARVIEAWESSPLRSNDGMLFERIEDLRASLASRASGQGQAGAVALSQACDLLSMSLGVLMGAKQKIGYVDRSPIAQLIAEAVEFLRLWPEHMPIAAPRAAIAAREQEATVTEDELDAIESAFDYVFHFASDPKDGHIAQGLCDTLQRMEKRLRTTVASRNESPPPSLQSLGGDAGVSEAMVDAYLQANDAYWKRTDQLPTPPDKWRTGTPREATRESLRAALSLTSTEKSDGWLPIETAPQDEHVLVAASGDWVFEARQDLNDDGSEQIWQWVTPDGRLLHKDIVPLAWMPKPASPAHLNAGGANG